MPAHIESLAEADALEWSFRPQLQTDTPQRLTREGQGQCFVENFACDSVRTFHELVGWGLSNAAVRRFADQCLASILGDQSQQTRLHFVYRSKNGVVLAANRSKYGSQKLRLWRFSVVPRLRQLLPISTSTEKKSPNLDVEHGMESSRSGPLTTFIMMLPLIVVPTVAMLKPANLKEGWASQLLSASDHPATADAEHDAPEFGADIDDFDEFGLFVDESESSADSDSDEDALFREAFADPLTSVTAEPSATTPAAPQQLSSADLAPLMTQLEKMGATRTLWFTPGNQMVGFVAFFEPDRGKTSYRFESIALSQAAAAKDVIQQVKAWESR